MGLIARRPGRGSAKRIQYGANHGALSPEELALTFAQLGRPEVGKGVLEHQLGIGLSQEEVYARLTSAGHSLLARDWMTLTGDDQIVVDPALHRMATALTRADFSIHSPGSRGVGAVTEERRSTI